jgi:hypothetical protein
MCVEALVTPSVTPKLCRRTERQRDAKRKWAFSRKYSGVGRAGLEPATLGLKVPCSTN